ncbi:MAG: hypothetical protein ABJA83_13265 [Burkholderiaceae bacterium]
MISHGRFESVHPAGRTPARPHTFPTHFAAALAVLVALTSIDATPRMMLELVGDTQLRIDHYMPSACGAEALARDRARRESDSKSVKQEAATELS